MSSASAVKKVNFKKDQKKSSSAKDIVEPKPGSNAFHWYNFEQKVKMGDKYSYQNVLESWRKMSDAQKQPFQERAQGSPKHKKLPGRQRAVSGYDVLRRELTKYEYKRDDWNVNSMASDIRGWLMKNEKETWDSWTTTSVEKHLKLIDRAIRDLE